MKYRHEIKFMVSDSQLERVRYRISAFMKQDENQKGDFYTITSVYFDDEKDSCLQDNINGHDRRNKYRIRIYDNDFGCIKLEKKSKLHTMIRKEFALISKEECHALLDGKYLRIHPDFSDEKKRLFYEMQQKVLRPKSIVEYDRVAYVFPTSNIRITFDKNIRGTPNVHHFFETHIPTMPLLGTGVHILEVKYDEFMPRFVYDSLEIGTLQTTAFSKYSFSR